MRNITETPERWVILKVLNGYKVYGTWAGGYLDSDSWKLNSGITQVEQDDDYYYFTGYSGSCYKCHKKGYGVMTSYGQGVLNNILDTGEGFIELLDDQDWTILKL